MKTQIENWLSGSDHEFFSMMLYWLMGSIVVNAFLYALTQWSKQ